MTTCPAFNPSEGLRATRRWLTALAAWALALSPALTAAAGDDLDALALESAPPAETQAASPTKVFVEAAAGGARLRGGQGSRDIGRLSVDARHSGHLGDALRTTLSARLDATEPEDPLVDNPVFSLREAFISWQDADATRVLEFGRINLRNGPAYGYNPTDFLRDNALRTITTVNPFTLRENRLGTVMFRGQHLWADGSAALLFAPELSSGRSGDGFSADWGATNARDRALLTLDQRWSEVLSSQLSLYKEDGSSTRLGVSATALLSDAIVAHAEWAGAKEADLLARALSTPEAAHRRNRVAAGLTYTTAFKLSLTGEYQYNGFALDDAGWRALPALGANAVGAYFFTAQARQDNAARQAWLLYATQRDLVVKNLELTALLKSNRSDGSRLVWVDLRYRMPKLDLALQLQHHSGAATSEFGSIPVRSSAGLLAAYYF